MSNPTFWVAASLILAVAGCESHAPIDADDGAAEYEDLIRDLDVGCNRCFYFVAADIIVPLPSRYLVDTRRGHDGCQSFSTLSSHPTFMRAIITASPHTLRSAAGSIDICDSDVLLSRVLALDPSARDRPRPARGHVARLDLPSASLRDGTTIHRTLLIGADVSILIEDINGLLPNAMFEFIERHSKQFDSASSGAADG